MDVLTHLGGDEHRGVQAATLHRNRSPDLAAVAWIVVFAAGFLPRLVPAAPPSTQPLAPPTRRPNILFIAVDEQLGRSSAAMAGGRSVRRTSIVVLLGDHGWNLGEHGLWCKHVCYETAMRAPLIVAALGKPGRGRARGLVEFIDIYPSLCELAGLPSPPHLEGSSFVPLLTDPDLPGRPAAVGRYGSGDTIRTDRHRFSEDTGPHGAAAGRMLLDHETDADELVNLAERPEAPGPNGGVELTPPRVLGAMTGGHAAGGRATGGCCDVNRNQEPRSHDTSRKSLGETHGPGGGGVSARVPELRR